MKAENKTDRIYPAVPAQALKDMKAVTEDIKNIMAGYQMIHDTIAGMELTTPELVKPSMTVLYWSI